MTKDVGKLKLEKREPFPPFELCYFGDVICAASIVRLGSVRAIIYSCDWEVFGPRGGGCLWPIRSMRLAGILLLKGFEQQCGLLHDTGTL